MTHDVEIKDHTKEIKVETDIDLEADNVHLKKVVQHLVDIDIIKHLATAEVVKTGSALSYSLVFNDGKTWACTIDISADPRGFTISVPAFLPVTIFQAVVDFIIYTNGVALEEMVWTKIEATFF